MNFWKNLSTRRKEVFFFLSMVLFGVLKEFLVYNLPIMAVPKGIDPAIKERLQAACAAAVEDPDFVTFMNNGGYTIAYQNAEEYTAFLAQSLTDVGEAMESLGL